MTAIDPYLISQTFLCIKYKQISFLSNMPINLSTYIFYPRINEYSKSMHNFHRLLIQVIHITIFLKLKKYVTTCKTFAESPILRD